MKFAVTFATTTIGICLILCSCQTAPDDAPVKKPAPTLDYTLLGIWPERYQAHEITEALKVAGIASTLSGNTPTALNVESSKLGQAKTIIASNPNWQRSAIVLNDKDDTL